MYNWDIDFQIRPISALLRRLGLRLLLQWPRAKPGLLRRARQVFGERAKLSSQIPHQACFQRRNRVCSPAVLGRLDALTTDQ